MNLAEVPKNPRFKITDKVWPEKAGNASICLWDDDKLVALSVTVDDNSAPDVDWWLEKTKAYKFPVTWFVISGNVTPQESYGGTWALWARVLKEGQNVESHSVTHFKDTGPGWKGIDWEYAHSQDQLDANLPGHKVRFLAYPGGKGSDNNDPAVAAKYYNAARGNVGTLNAANKISYMRTNSVSSVNVGNLKAPWADPYKLFEPKNLYYRGWSIQLFHRVGDPAKVQPLFDFIDAKRDDLWLGQFGDVALYGQERDTATLKVEENTSDHIAFTLTDRMADDAFNTPLTVKVRLPDGWNTVTATQNSKAISASVVEHDGAKYALVKAVPDKGQALLKN